MLQHEIEGKAHKHTSLKPKALGKKIGQRHPKIEIGWCIIPYASAIRSLMDSMMCTHPSVELIPISFRHLILEWCQKNFLGIMWEHSTTIMLVEWDCCPEITRANWAGDLNECMSTSVDVSLVNEGITYSWCSKKERMVVLWNDVSKICDRCRNNAWNYLAISKFWK